MIDTNTSKKEICGWYRAVKAELVVPQGKNPYVLFSLMKVKKNGKVDRLGFSHYFTVAISDLVSEYKACGVTEAGISKENLKAEENSDLFNWYGFFELLEKEYINKKTGKVKSEILRFVPCDEDTSIPLSQSKWAELKQKRLNKIKLSETEQHKTDVKYDIEQSTRNGYYPFYTAPTPKTEIFPYRRSKVQRRGYSEENFEQMLRSSLKNSTNYHVLEDISIHTFEHNNPYEPDIAIVETSDNYGIRIDIEIDEPYAYTNCDGIPIHYVGCGDESRDRKLASLGWIVIRFSEKQIVQEPKNCIYYLQKLINLIDPNFSISCGDTIPMPDKCWTESEARIMITKKFREKLLNHEFSIKKRDNIIITTPLTKLEEELANNANSTHIPIIQHNIDNTDMEFIKDSTAVSSIINKFFKHIKRIITNIF